MQKAEQLSLKNLWDGWIEMESLISLLYWMSDVSELIYLFIFQQALICVSCKYDLI